MKKKISLFVLLFLLVLTANFQTTNAAAKELLDDKIKNDPGRYPPQDVLDRCEVFETIPADNIDYIEAWDMIKAK